MSGVEICLKSLHSVWAIGPHCRRSVRYDVKFVIDRVKNYFESYYLHFRFSILHVTLILMLLASLLTGHSYRT